MSSTATAAGGMDGTGSYLDRVRIPDALVISSRSASGALPGIPVVHRNGRADSSVATET